MCGRIVQSFKPTPTQTRCLQSRSLILAQTTMSPLATSHHLPQERSGSLEECDGASFPIGPRRAAAMATPPSIPIHLNSRTHCHPVPVVFLLRVFSWLLC